MRRALGILFFVALAPSAHASYWRPAGAPGRAAVLTVHPKRSSTYTVDLPALRRRLGTTRTVRLPAPDGTLERFRVRPQASMAAGADRRASGFHGFTGSGVDDPTATVRLDYSVLGVHASVRSRRGNWYVDPAVAGRAGRYLSYFGQALVPGPRSERTPVSTLPRGRSLRALPLQGDLVKRRTYRVALASDPSYATAAAPTAAGATLDAKVTAAKETLIARVDQIYNDDLGIHLQLIAGNAALNFNTSAAFTAAYTSGVTNCYSTNTKALAQNQAVVDDPSRVGTGNYDIGHLVFGPDGDGGGVAGLGVVGTAGRKAQGCTGLAVPYGDAFAVDYVAHEMGHQFGANHTFDGSNGSCGGGNRSASAAVEPGSGSSIMAYAGICGTDNLQAHSDPYFSERSIQEIQTYVTGNASAGGAASTTANHSPVVTAPSAATIPVRTPFTLAGSAADPDADPLVYSWEQNDVGSGFSLGSNSHSGGALFRQFGLRSTESDADSRDYAAAGENHATSADAVRSFPDVAQVAADNTDAAAGTCPALTGTPAQIDCFSEFLPTTARTLHFRLTARDLFPSGGGVSAADTTVTVAGTRPFRVTTAYATADPGVPVPVQWDVAGTDSPPFDVASVSIAYSTDGGLTFPTVLAASTPNDGMETVTIPQTLTTNARFKVAAVGSPFYDVSHADLDVTPGGGTPTTTTTTTTTTPTTATATAVPDGAPTGASPPAATATPSPAPSATPVPLATIPPSAYLQPDLARTKRTVAVSRRRTFRLRVRCLPVGTVAVPARCKGAVRVTYRRGQATKAFSLRAGATGTITLRVSRRAYRSLRHQRLKARVRATVGTHLAKKEIVFTR